MGKEVAVRAPTKLRPLAKVSGAQFEISIDGTPRTYRDRKEFAIKAAEHLKRKHPNSDIVVKDLRAARRPRSNTNLIWGHADTDEATL